MGQSFFIWKNRDCRSMGIWLQGPVPIVRPEERINHVQIPGRSGDLTELEGEDVYNSYIQTATILVKGGYRTREIFDWLKGSGYVTFSGEPDLRQPARVIGAVTLSKHSYNLDWWVGEVQFYCQPLKEKLQEEKVTVTTSGTAVINAGDVIAKPLLKITASAATMTITAGGKTLTLTDYQSGDVCLVDCETMMVTNAAGTADWTKWSSGEFPVLLQGSNAITGSGWSSVEITKRERFL